MSNNSNQATQSKPLSAQEKPQDNQSKNFTSGTDALEKNESNKQDQPTNDSRDEKSGNPGGANFAQKRPENDSNVSGNKSDASSNSEKR